MTLKTLKMVSKLNSELIAASSSGYMVTKDNLGHIIHCNEDGSTNEAMGYEGWVCLTKGFLEQEWVLVRI